MIKRTIVLGIARHIIDHLLQLLSVCLRVFGEA